MAIHATSIELDPLGGGAEQILRLAGGVFAAKMSIGSSWTALRSVDPSELNVEDVKMILGELGKIRDVTLLKSAFMAVVRRGLTLEKGVCPEAPALQVYKRILEIDPNDGISIFGEAFSPDSCPGVDAGYFQLSLAGALADALAGADLHVSGLGQMRALLDLITDPEHSPYKGSMRTAVMSAVFVVTFVLEDSSSDGLRRIAEGLGACVDSLQADESPFFLQGVADGLGACHISI